MGEYAALVFAGSVSFENAVRLIKVRSQAMQEACDLVDSAMVTALGRSTTRFKRACEYARNHLKRQKLIEEPVCSVSAYLCPNMVTIAGHTEAIRYLREHKDDLDIRKIIPIPVSGAFHTKLMRTARAKLRAALKDVLIEPPLVDVYSNCTGKVYEGPDEIARSLPQQVVQSVKWEQTVHNFLRGCGQGSLPHLYEVGPGQQLGALVRQCNGRAFKQYLAVNPIAK